MRKRQVHDFRRMAKPKQPSVWSFFGSIQESIASVSLFKKSNLVSLRRVHGTQATGNSFGKRTAELRHRSKLAKSSDQDSLKSHKKNSLLIIAKLFGGVILRIINIFLQVFRKFGLVFSKLSLIKVVFTVVFLAIIVHFANLQVFTNSARNSFRQEVLAGSTQIILSQRGQIYIQDLSQNQAQDKKYIPLTSTQSVANLFFNPNKLKGYLKEGLELEVVAETIAGSLNLPYESVYTLLKQETDKNEPLKYVLIQRFINQNQKTIVEHLKRSSTTRRIVQAAGLDIEEKEIRSYPEGSLLGPTVGYVLKQQVTREEALKTECQGVVKGNEERGTVSTYIPGDFSKAEYTVAYYGLEQKFCTELSGLNGRRTLNSEVNSEQSKDTRVRNGASIYTTIDKNLQIKAEQVLDDAIKKNTNSNGEPKNGTVIVMQATTGRILAMASAPGFDPNRYADYPVESFRNVATSLDYEVGSVMKPLTIAAALNEFQSGNLNSKGEPLGVAPDFQFEDYDKAGKVYQDNSGNKFFIQNAMGRSYSSLGRIGLDKCMIYSINTCISDITDSLGTRKMQEYMSEKYLFGKPTAVDLPGDMHGNVTNLNREINCLYCYAQHGFGQGILISPLQLLRAYTAIANGGTLVEPYLVEKIKYADGTEDDGSTEDSAIKRDSSRQILKESASRLVTQQMVKVIEETAPGVGANKAKVDGYTIAGKTGTAEKITRVDGELCSYQCNRMKGIYDHTFVGFNANSGNPILILVKLAEPRPGVVDNFSGDTVGPAFAEMMKYTLEYLGIKSA